ncbi:MAG TPA: hypothetical protein VG756_13615 [Pseudonocardiaceae bacterium]|jgi:hypothetical protein|nr:hypothetical protein [Pseudonocardiaceae bacterium]
MSGSLEIRKLLWQENDTLPRHSSDVPSQRTGAEPARISADQVRRARLAVARNARDADDCRQLLDMLGLAPDENGVPPVRH